MTFLHMFPDSFLHMFFLMAALCTQNSPQDFIRLFRVSASCGCGGRGWGLGESPPVLPEKLACCTLLLFYYLFHILLKFSKKPKQD